MGVGSKGGLRGGWEQLDKKGFTLREEGWTEVELVWLTFRDEDNELTEGGGNWVIVVELLEEVIGCKELGADWLEYRTSFWDEIEAELGGGHQIDGELCILVASSGICWLETWLADELSWEIEFTLDDRVARLQETQKREN